MYELIKNLTENRDNLQNEIQQIEYFLETAPEGRIVFGIEHGQQRTLLVQKGTDGKLKRKYLGQKNLSLKEALARKSYYQNLLPLLTTEKEKTEKDILFYTEADDKKEKCYTSLAEERKRFLNPLYLSDIDYARKWIKTPYETKGITEKEQFFITNRREKVRSKSELIIANALAGHNIPYRYEEKTQIKGCGFPLFPDFTVLNIRTRQVFYWEHFGMMENPEYAVNTVRKINTYTRGGIIPGKQLIMTFESGTIPINTGVIDSTIREYLI